MDAADLSEVNPHYLQNVMALAETHKVVASEDVYDARGVKLIAKGAKIDGGMQERLVRFKLRQPLEKCLAVEGGVGPEALIHEAQALLEQLAPLCTCMGNSTRLALATLKQIQFDRVSGLLLTMEQANQGGAFSHAVLASLMSVGIGIQLNLDDATLLSLAAAGLLHDIGELYIQPEFRRPTRQLTPEEWKHIAAHPRIGQLVIEETTHFPRSIANAVAEHHERPNGFGYPKQLAGERISRVGKVLLMSELLCGIFTKPDKLEERACLAVKVIPGEYPADIVSLIMALRRDTGALAGHAVEADRRAAVIAHAQRIEQALSTALARVATPPPQGKPAAPALIERVQERLSMLRNAMHSTGLSGCAELHNTQSDDAAYLVLEMETVIYEIEWRLRELARQITLNLPAMDAAQREYFAGVVGSLG